MERRGPPPFAWSRGIARWCSGGGLHKGGRRVPGCGHLAWCGVCAAPALVQWKPGCSTPTAAPPKNSTPACPSSTCFTAMGRDRTPPTTARARAPANTTQHARCMFLRARKALKHSELAGREPTKSRKLRKCCRGGSHISQSAVFFCFEMQPVWTRLASTVASLRAPCYSRGSSRSTWHGQTTTHTDSFTFLTHAVARLGAAGRQVE